MEFRKEDDKEEAVQGSDPPPLAATLPTFHTGVRTLLAAAPGGGRIRGLAGPEHRARQAALLSTTRPRREEHER